MKISFLNGDAVRLPDAIGMVPPSVMSEDIENGKVNAETIDRNHTMFALRELNEEFPSEKCFKSRGSALTDGRPQVFRRYKTFMPAKRISPLKMTPENYTYPFLQGKSKEIAKEQLSRLQELSIEKDNSIEITQSIPGPSSTSDQIELNKRKRKLFKPKQKSPKGKAGGVKSKGKTNIKRKADGRQTSSKGKGKAGKPTTSVPDPPGPSPMENEEKVSNNDEMDNVLHISNYNYFILSCLSSNEFIRYS
ncbi:unnamed protein product [Mytilus coruscus]|uniref:Uncharacterized protein n=1 Tax=Mytilus coruscus TaxID=42192 RepID=A0A6J8C551_MYTCO|nr:unnamed protein product [Mytilus coruscus]